LRRDSNERSQRSTTRLTITGNCNTLEHLETICFLKSGDLSMRKFREELRLLVVHVVFIFSGQFERNSPICSSCPDLITKQISEIVEAGVGRKPTHDLARGLRRDSPKGGGHFDFLAED
jgi:hypothetical protein